MENRVGYACVTPDQDSSTSLDILFFFRIKEPVVSNNHVVQGILDNTVAASHNPQSHGPN